MHGLFFPYLLLYRPKYTWIYINLLSQNGKIIVRPPTQIQKKRINIKKTFPFNFILLNIFFFRKKSNQTYAPTENYWEKKSFCISFKYKMPNSQTHTQKRLAYFPKRNTKNKQQHYLRTAIFVLKWNTYYIIIFVIRKSCALHER